ncbi:peroxidase family protein [Phycicoccus sonneratiae]|uniref:peroxidase family protein n=1 Tax=Phycicoccus sonneratiae TaxID=2807628 RepID=UPI0027DDCD6A|nr:peroxidase family protein [Phycicoccus sonneraticus]
MPARGGRGRSDLPRRALAVVVAAVTLGVGTPPAQAASSGATVGAGFTVTRGDLAFILKQVRIAERHTTTLTPADPCGTLLNRPGDGIPDVEQVPDILTAYGLRTVDGSCNNLKSAATFRVASADELFPRLTTPVFRDADPITPSLPVGAPGPTSYSQRTGAVVDAEPRVVSNLVADQTMTNPAAVAAAGHPVRSQGQSASAVPCTTDPDPSTDPPVVADPPGCTPSHQTLFIPNITTDVGLSPPYNSLFTFFGQFFDHGIDQTVKGGASVFVPLRADDPLVTVGPDGRAGTGDEVPPSRRFMVLTRARNQKGPDGVLGTSDDVREAANTDTPWIDQSQTYTSHASHQVFLREYGPATGPVGATRPAAVATGRLLDGLPAGATYAGSPDMTGGESSWAAVRRQSRELLGLALTDKDALDVPMLAVDPYGNYLPGPARGLPQYVTAGGLVEGDTTNPVPVPADVAHFDTPFLTDIAHAADPSPVDTDHDGAPDTWPTPDADAVVTTGPLAAGTYDDELLASHAACGDGRCNENIALTAVHQVFHSEHNRLVDEIRTSLEEDTSTAGRAALAQWQAVGVAGAGGTGSWTYGQRLFQAARFIAEMEYQHLVFEEFGRKVQPAIRPFHVYSPDVDPAVTAEFAHAVYRFGHSMLDETVSRHVVAPDGTRTDASLPLLDAFLSPPTLYDGGPAGTLTAAEGAGAVVMGSSDQTGNEIDEFVTETLRNNLLGLPLDLATLNIARARDAGVPPLNEVRRQLFARTHDAALTPYESWSDLGQHLKHPETLVNLVAAYGRHPSVVSATTTAARRGAARAIVDPRPSDTAPADAADFMYGTGDWAGTSGGVTTTGVDDVDLWVGGLAEATNLGGGMLGSTFNHVFQRQMEDLQDHDRLYYLARTPGMNLRTQLEGNSFSEIIMRNTSGTRTLKADAFARADCKFDLANLEGTPAGWAASGATVADDPTSDCDEGRLLLRRPDGTIQYRATNTVDPPGLNGQAVYDGTAGTDRVAGGVDDDTVWGGAGDDVVEGGGGDDVVLGGPGDDRITDLDGADVPKGGPGDDAIDAGPGNDIVHGNDGNDLLNGGANDNEVFAGPGDDLVIAGQGADVVFGGGGDDWIQGGTGQDLLQGDHGAPFFDDPAETAPGNDVFVGQVGENDYDAEGGDDVMAQNATIDRNAGAAGFDWAIHQYDTVAADDDLMINNNLGGLPIQVVTNRDRWAETEAVSGGPLNDRIKGTSNALAFPRLVGGGGFSGCDAVDEDGLARIEGLAAVLPPVATWVGTAEETAALSASGRCPLTGRVWGEGDVLLGGGGSDTVTGRAGDDVIDGDKELRVALSVRTDPADPATELGTTDLLENAARTGSFGPGTAGMTLQAAVFRGLVDPGHVVVVRRITTPATPVADCGTAVPLNCDVATYVGPRSQYVITPNADGSLGVRDTTSGPPAVGGATRGDGTDRLRNIEALQFSDQRVLVRTPAAPATVTATAGTSRNATVSWTAPPAGTGASYTSYTLVVRADGAEVGRVTGIGTGIRARVVTGLVAGRSYTFAVLAVNLFGDGAERTSGAVTVVGPPLPPTALVAVRGNGSAVLAWTPGDTGGLPLTGYQLQVRTGTTVVETRSLSGAPTNTTVTGLTVGTGYSFRLQAVNALGTSTLSAASNTVVPVGVPGAPTMLAPAQGPAGGALTAVASWSAPSSTGGSPITGYRVTALRMDTDGVTPVGAPTTVVVGAAVRTRSFTLPAGSYRFEVVALNANGEGPASQRSTPVAPR